MISLALADRTLSLCAQEWRSPREAAGETADRFQRALATYTLVAWRLLWLTYQARATPEASPLTALSPLHLNVLIAFQAKRSPQTPLPSAPTLGQVIRGIAALGGFLGRKADGDPGVTTLSRGLRRLDDLVAGAALFMSTDMDNG